MLSSTGWVQSIVIFLVSFFFFNTAPLPLNVALGFFGAALGFFVNVNLTGAPGAFFNVGGATVFLIVTAAVKDFLGRAAAAAATDVACFFSTGFFSTTGVFSAIFLVTAGAFFATSGSFLAALTGSGFFSPLDDSFLSFLAGLEGSSAGRFGALPLDSSLTFLGSSFFPLVGGAACCWPFLLCLTSGSLAFGFSGSDFLPLGSALADLGLSLADSTLALGLEGCCVAGFLPLSFLLSATFFCAGAYKQTYTNYINAN